MAEFVIDKSGLPEGGSDSLASFLKVYAGEVITAFSRSAMAVNNHMVRTISTGKTAQFPVMGRATAKYLIPGNSLDDQRTAIAHNEVDIGIDGLLTTDAMITDIYDAMSHFDVRAEYANQMGEALAIAADGAVIAEIASMAVGQKENLAGLGKGSLVTRALATSDQGITETEGKAIVSMLLELKADMSNKYVPASDRFVYMTPTGVSALINSWTAINRDFGAMGTIIDGNVTRLCGFNIIEVPHLVAGGVDGTNVLSSGKAHTFPSAYESTAVFVAGHRSAVGTVKLRDLSVEQGRRIDRQANQVVAKYAMGHGGLRPEATALGYITTSA